MTLWKHQQEAVELLATYKNFYIHGGMGIGKTLITIEAIRRYELRRVLIVCPVSVLSVWGNEFEKHYPEANIIILDNGSVKRKTELARLSRGIVIVNYDAFWRTPFDRFAYSESWDLIVYDEAHRIKGYKAKSSKFAAKLHQRSGRVLALSGTPMPHSPLDIYAQYRAMDPEIFGRSVTQFRSRYCQMGGYENREIVKWINQDDMQHKIDSRMMHISRDVVDLPDTVDLDRYSELEPEERKAYEQLKKQLVSDIQNKEVTIVNGLVRLLRLQQCICGCLRDDLGNDLVIGNSRFNTLVDVLQDLMGEPVVVFCRYRHDTKMINDASIKLYGRECSELSGARNQLSEWQTLDDRKILAVQIQAGSVGIDMTKAHYCIFYSVGFSLGDYEQARCRVHRPGQSSKVTYIKIMAPKTIDVQLYKAINAKRDLAQAVLEGL